MQDQERNKAAVRRVVDELFNQRALGVADELFTADHRNHAGQAYSGPQGMMSQLGLLPPPSAS